MSTKRYEPPQGRFTAPQAQAQAQAQTVETGLGNLEQKSMRSKT